MAGDEELELVLYLSESGMLRIDCHGVHDCPESTSAHFRDSGAVGNAVFDAILHLQSHYRGEDPAEGTTLTPSRLLTLSELLQQTTPVVVTVDDGFQRSEAAEAAALWGLFWSYSPVLTPLPTGVPCWQCAKEVLHFMRKAKALKDAGDMYFLRRISEAQNTWTGCVTGIGSGDIGWHEL